MKNITFIETYLKRHQGFSLVEAIVVFVIGAILLTTLGSLYVKWLKLDLRQSRLIDVEKSLASTQTTLEQSLVTLPARGLATSNGQSFNTPILPAFGSIPNDKGQLTPITLGVVTPYKVNGFDAVTIVYADAKRPRFSLSQAASQLGNIGTARIALPSNVSTTFLPGAGSDKEDNSTIAEQNQRPPVKDLPTPSPSSSPTSSPNPRNTPTPDPSSNEPDTPPNVPLEQTLNGLAWIPNPDMFQPGEIMLLVSTPPYQPDDAVEPTRPISRFVKIVSATQTTQSAGTAARKFINVTYNVCANGECADVFPSVINPVISPRTEFDIGATLVPIKVTSFYLKQDQMSSRVVRNDGGVILPDGNGNFVVQGGSEINLGEIDSISVSYQLKNLTTVPTPNTPLVSWLNDIKSVNITLTRVLPAGQGAASEQITRKATINFPIVIQNLE
ncbi:MAG: prepilin-type N-terminal cleavage/methylation domain-containing protein [Blastocatellia bacterium]|nr:prepilin-type N-terminal cleavage/methylation domain-containing protein [Blastocatellia bacterium]